MTTALDLTQVTFTLNGVEITGWSDDSDALAFPQSSERYITKFGAGGFMTASASGARFGGEVTIKLAPTSPSSKFLVSNMQQEQSGGLPINYDGFFRDHLSGWTVEMQRGILTTGPLGPSIGSGDFGNFVFVFTFERIIQDMSAANFGN